MKKIQKILEIHPGTSCSLKCIFCYRANQGYDASHAHIAEKRLIELIHEFADLGGQEIFISGGMEPFSQPVLVSHIIEHAHQAGLKIRVYSNGVAKALADPKVWDMLVLRTDQVRFSIHAIKPHTYRQVTHTDYEGPTLSTAISNVSGVINARSFGSKTEIGIGFLVLPENIDELIRAAKMWRDQGVDFFDVRFDAVADSNRGTKMTEQLREFLELVEDGEFEPLRINCGDYAHHKPEFATKCYAPFEKLVVDPFGCIWSCCLQSQCGYRPKWAKVGDLSSESFLSIVENLKEFFPATHCETCTPWEANYNLMREEEIVCSENIALHSCKHPAAAVLLRI